MALSAAAAAAALSAQQQPCVHCGDEHPSHEWCTCTRHGAICVPWRETNGIVQGCPFGPTCGCFSAPLPPLAAVAPGWCPGRREPAVQNLFGLGPQGRLSGDELGNLAVFPDAHLPEPLKKLRQHGMHHAYVRQSDVLVHKWVGDVDRVRSTLCWGAVAGNMPCPACAALDLEQLQRTAQAAQRRIEQTLPPASQLTFQGKATGGGGAGLAELRARLAAAVRVAVERLKRVADLEAQLSEAETRQLREVAAAGTSGASMEQVVELLREIEEQEADPHSKAKLSLLTGAVRGLAGDSSRRSFSTEEKLFYGLLLSYGGPVVAKFVAANLGGPRSMTSIRDWRSGGGKRRFIIGDLDGTMAQVRGVGIIRNAGAGCACLGSTAPRARARARACTRAEA